MWKLLSGIFADKIYYHLLDANLFPEEQKGCKRKSRGTKDQLVIDKAILTGMEGSRLFSSQCLW